MIEHKMSLLEEKWLPVRRKNGQIDWIAPYQITEPDIVAFAANRADFNGGLAQLMIGLLQTAAPVSDESGWEDLLEAPPSTETLQAWFATLSDAFAFDGDGAHFMQDFSLTEGAACTIDALLIDAAGSSAIDKNTDHFVKREIIKAMCPHCAATALFTLQTNAPAGGAGHRTSLRGGGPLTTLVIATPTVSLWHDLWLNVKPQARFLEQSGDVKKMAKYFTFPWLAEISKIQTAGGETQPMQVHPHHVFWAMPRRIRLDFSGLLAGICDVCKRPSPQLIQSYITKPQGLNYKGVWRHPFSPYYETKEGWLPVHPQPGGFSYKNWLSWAIGSTQSKKNVQAASAVTYAQGEHRQKSYALRLWVFGYDMDNMKARCWYETTFPLYKLDGASVNSKKSFASFVQSRIEASEQAAYYLRQAVKQAWFGDSDLRGDLSFVDKAFWDATESYFYEQIKQLLAHAQSLAGIKNDDAAAEIAFSEAWLTRLKQTALRLFDIDIVGAGSIAQQDPRRIAGAYNGLKRNFNGNAIKTILGLPVTEKTAKSGGKAKKVKANTATESAVTDASPLSKDEK